MKKFSIKNFLLENSKYFVASLIGAIIGSTVVGYAATIIYSGSQVGYDNSTSRLNSNDVQGALDELFDVADLSDRVTTLESTSTTIGNRISAVETSITSLGTRLTTLEARGGVSGWAPSNVDVPNSTNTVLLSFTVPTGGKSYTISGSAVFPSNATGYRRVFIAKDDACTSWLGNAWSATASAVSGVQTIIGFSATTGTGASGQTWYLCGTQNSGSTLSTAGRVYLSVN